VCVYTCVYVRVCVDVCVSIDSIPATPQNSAVISVVYECVCVCVCVYTFVYVRVCVDACVNRFHSGNTSSFRSNFCCV